VKRILQIICLIALAFGYFRWAVASAARLKASLSRADRGAVAEMVDFRGFRKSMGQEWHNAWEKVMVADDPRNAEQIHRGMTEPPPEADDPHILEMMYPDDKILETILQPGNWDDGKWRSPFAYAITNRLNGTQLILRFGRTGWKLSGIEYGLAQAREAIHK